MVYVIRISCLSHVIDIFKNLILISLPERQIWLLAFRSSTVKIGPVLEEITVHKTHPETSVNSDERLEDSNSLLLVILRDAARLNMVIQEITFNRFLCTVLHTFQYISNMSLSYFLFQSKIFLTLAGLQ